jgi:uncharacterized protein
MSMTRSAATRLGRRIAGAAMLAAAQFGGMAPLAAAASTEPATASANRQTIAAAFDRWAAGGTAFFDEVLAPDVTWTIEGSGPSAGTFRGRDDLVARAVRPLTSRLATPIRPLQRRIWADGEHVIVHWTGEATARDGQPYRNTYLWILRMQDGRAREVTAFLDLVPYDDVLRRIPAPAPTVQP